MPSTTRDSNDDVHPDTMDASSSTCSTLWFIDSLGVVFQIRCFKSSNPCCKLGGNGGNVGVGNVRNMLSPGSVTGT